MRKERGGIGGAIPMLTRLRMILLVQHRLCPPFSRMLRCTHGSQISCIDATGSTVGKVPGRLCGGSDSRSPLLRRRNELARIGIQVIYQRSFKIDSITNLYTSYNILECTSICTTGSWIFLIHRQPGTPVHWITLCLGVP